MDYLKEAKKYFPDNYSYLVNMSACKDLDGLFECIKKLVQKEGGKENVTTHQLRNVYSMVKNAEGDYPKWKMTRPKFAYIAARQKKDGLRKNI